MVPLVLVFGFIVLSGLNGSNNYLMVGSYWTTPSSLFSSFSFERNEDFVGKRVAGGSNNKQEAISDDYNLNRSASPTLSVQAAFLVQPPSVSLFSLDFIIVAYEGDGTKITKQHELSLVFLWMLFGTQFFFY